MYSLSSECEITSGKVCAGGVTYENNCEACRDHGDYTLGECK
jgi:hypothetical protein